MKRVALLIAAVGMLGSLALPGASGAPSTCTVADLGESSTATQITVTTTHRWSVTCPDRTATDTTVTTVRQHTGTESVSTVDSHFRDGRHILTTCSTPFRSAKRTCSTENV